MENMDLHRDTYNAMEQRYFKTLHDLTDAHRDGALSDEDYSASLEAMLAAMLPGSTDKKNANITAVRATYHLKD